MNQRSEEETSMSSCTKLSYNTATSFASSPPLSPAIPMERTGKIIRKSVYKFLQNYQYFTSTAALLAFPFSASILLTQAFIPASLPLLPAVYNRLWTLFDAAGFPSSSEFFTIFNLKLSQTITASIFTFPFTLTFLLIAKAYVIQSFHHHKKPALTPSFSSIISLYNPLLLTYICNSFLILSANATAFCILFFAFNVLEGSGFNSSNCILFLSASGVVLYSIILANTLIICNLALVLSGMEKCGGYLAILNACVLIRGRTSTGLSLALPANLALAAIEALFQYRIVRAFRVAEIPSSSMILEGLFIAYLYSVLVVLDTIVSCMFFKTCNTRFCIDQEGEFSYRITIAEEDSSTNAKLKTLEELP